MTTRASLSNFDLNLLVALEVLLAERNVTRAAERLHLSQSAASGVLQRLRVHFADELLVRNGRELELTPLARALIVPVGEALASSRRVLATEAHFVPATAKRTFRLMMSDFCSHLLLPPLLARVAREAPYVRCEVELLGPAPFTRLETAAIDVVVTTNQWRLFRDDHYSGQLESAPLFDESFCCLVGKALPPDEPLTLGAFLRLPHVVASFGSRTPTHLDLALRRLDLGIHVTAEVPMFSFLPFVVASMETIAVVPRRLAEHFASLLALRVVDTPIDIPSVTETMLWHRRNTDEPAQRWMRGLIRDVSSKYDQRAAELQG